MKKLLFIFAFFPLFVFSQDYSEVIKVPGKTAIQLYGSAREWFAESFKSANDVLQLEDQTNGKLIGKGSMPIIIKYNSMLVSVPIILHATFTIKVAVKDSVYKYEIGSIFIESGGPHSINDYKDASNLDNARQVLIKEGGMRNPSDKLVKKTADFNAAIYECSNLEFKKTIESLKTKMKSTDNW